MTPTAIEWPKITLACGETFTLRYSYASDYQLVRWGKNLASASTLELAAAMAGEFIAPGKWRSRGFERPVDLADLMAPEDEKPLVEAVMVAVKNRYPELEVFARPIPGKETETTSDSGPSPQAETASVSKTNDSGA
jgi:hypothetical protein